MQVEVNEQNIVIYGLVQLTGNTAEEMLREAKEAEDKGYILTCQIPDIGDELLNMNVFDAAGSEPADRSMKHGGESPYGSMLLDENTISIFEKGRVVDVQFEGWNEPESNIVTGEVTESHVEE